MKTTVSICFSLNCFLNHIGYICVCLNCWTNFFIVSSDAGFETYFTKLNLKGHHTFMIYDKNNISEGYFQSVSASCRCIFKEFAAVRILHILVNINPSFQSFSDCIFLLFFYSFQKANPFRDGFAERDCRTSRVTLAFAQSLSSSLPLSYSNFLRMWFEFYLMVVTRLIKISVYLII